jgi:hypothetical protein
MTSKFKFEERYVHLVKTIGKTFFLPRESIFAGDHNHEVWGDCLAIPVDFFLYTALPAENYSCYHLFLRDDGSTAEYMKGALVYDHKRSINNTSTNKCLYFTFTHPGLGYTAVYEANPNYTLRYSGDYSHPDFEYPFIALRELENTSEDDPILDDMGPTICSLHKDSYRLKHEQNT